MINSIIISKSLLEEQGLTGIEFLYLHYLYTGFSLGIPYETVDKKKLEAKKLIKIITDTIILRQKSIDLVEFSLVEANISVKDKKIKVNKSNRAIGQEVNNFVDEFRNKWKGLKPGAMGGRRACEVKLVKWLTENPDYSFEQILKAVDLYLSTEGRDIRFLQRADYFIYKNDINRNEMSRLSAYIDDIALHTTEDWTSNLN